MLGLIFGAPCIIVGVMMLNTYIGFAEKYKDSKDVKVTDRAMYEKNLKIIERNKKIEAVLLIGIGCVILLFGSMPRNHRYVAKSATCKVCHREFTNEDDVRSIKRTNMCSNCYDNYEFGNAVREAEKNYEKEN